MYLLRHLALKLAAGGDELVGPRLQILHAPAQQLDDVCQLLDFGLLRRAVLAARQLGIQALVAQLLELLVLKQLQCQLG